MVKSKLKKSAAAGEYSKTSWIDSVPATIDGQEDLLVSKDEYVIDAPTVAMIGNGSSDAGAEKLDNMREEVRKAATGSRVQPKKIDAEGIMSLALAS